MLVLHLIKGLAAMRTYGVISNIFSALHNFLARVHIVPVNSYLVVYWKSQDSRPSLEDDLIILHTILHLDKQISSQGSSQQQGLLWPFLLPRAALVCRRKEAKERTHMAGSVQLQRVSSCLMCTCHMSKM